MSFARLADHTDYWHKAEGSFLRDYGATEDLTAPVGSIIHSLGDLNQQQSRGQPFFIDIVRTGSSYMILICPFLSGPKVMIFWMTTEIMSAGQETSPGRDYRQAAWSGGCAGAGRHDR